MNVIPGARQLLRMPWSELMMHLGYAGRTLEVELTPGGDVLVYDPRSGRLMTRCTYSEAGIFWGSTGYYAYAPMGEDDVEGEAAVVRRCLSTLEAIFEQAGAQKVTDLGLNWRLPAPAVLPENPRKKSPGRPRKLLSRARQLAETEGVSSGPEETPLL
jgi:hypothetical protein